MAYPTEGNMLRADLTRLIASIRTAYGLSAREYAKICGVSMGYFRVYAFTKKEGGTVTQETAGTFLAPFSFGFSPELLPPRKGPQHASDSRWRSGKTPEGYVPFAPVRDAMLSFKEEEKSSWQLIADHIGWDRTQLNKTFIGTEANTKQFMTRELADFFMKEIRKARSLSPAKRQEIFLSTRGESTFLPRRDLIRLLADFRYDYDIKTWKAVADELEVSPDRLKGMIHDRHLGVRRQTMYDVMDRIVRARTVREQRLNHRNMTLNRMYEHEERKGAA